MKMKPLEQIELAAKAFAKDRNLLVDIVTTLNDQIEKLKRRAMPEIKLAVESSAESQSLLQNLLTENKGLFEKPRTVVFHGFKIGFAKQKGRIEIKDEAKTIELIRKHLPDSAELLIVKKESISKDALANISVDAMKRIGCTVIADTDQPVIKATNSEVDKVVNAFLKGAQDDKEAA